MSQHLSWQFAIKTFAAAIIVLSTGYTFFLVGPVLETRYFPVLDKLQIVSITPLAENVTEVNAAFRKRRPCDYIGIAWYRRIGPDEFIRVPIALRRDPDDLSSPNRPLGFQRAGPWEIGMPADDIRDDSFVEIFHTCHLFWVTRTEFYP